MTETTLKVKLNEVTVVRINCRKGKCGGVIEVPVERLSRIAKNSSKCPICNEEFVMDLDRKDDPIPDLGRALMRLRELEPNLVLEFPIRLDDPKEPAPH